MITQNPIIGRARKKVSGIYARTLYGKNILQSCPTPSNKPPTPAQLENRKMFSAITQMASMLPDTLLNQIYYTAPVGRSRRQMLAKQLFTGVSRESGYPVFDAESISEIGTNPVVSDQPMVVTFTQTSSSLLLDEVPRLPTAIVDEVPLIIACEPSIFLFSSLLPYTTISGNNLVLSNLSESFLNNTLVLFFLWKTDISQTSTPNIVFGSYSLQI